MSNAAPQQPSIADRLRRVRVAIRRDLDTTRHVFRGQPSYVITDPLTFSSHRLDPADYEIFACINASQELGEIFEELVEKKLLRLEDEENFYQFVFQLHQLGFLNLPVTDASTLYRRHRARERARRKARLMGILFLQIPLWNPDRFLEKTVHCFRPLFSRIGLAIWMVLVLSAGFVVYQNRGQILEPLNGLLAARNLACMWFMLVGLKICHEFGHAYACKHFGVHVPQMGAYLIAGTPCAYVDATGSWQLNSRFQRIAICLAGMYFESFIAAGAVFIWAFTSPGLLQSMAYNVMFLASTITVLFNINPLMRYDGYYVFSDLVDIPNLRTRATQYALSVLKRLTLGIRTPMPAMTRRMRCTLLLFGVAASIYRSMVMIGIAALVATKLFFLGIAIGILYIGSMLVGIGRRLASYLWFAEETAHIRVRAVAVSILFFIGIPSVIALVPMRSSIRAAGVITAEHVTILRATEPGFLQRAAVDHGQRVHTDTLIAQLSNDTCAEALATAQARLEATKLRHDAYAVDQPALARQEQERIPAHAAEIRRRRKQLDHLTVHAPTTGTIVRCLREQDHGRYIQAGGEIACIISGCWQVRTLLSEEECSAAEPRVGDVVEFRAAHAPDTTFQGVITRIKPAGEHQIDLASLTHAGGGRIVVDTTTGHSTKPYFEIVVTLNVADHDLPQYGVTGQLQLGARPEPVALTIYRRVVRFLNTLAQA